MSCPCGPSSRPAAPMMGAACPQLQYLLHSVCSQAAPCSHSPRRLKEGRGGALRHNPKLVRGSEKFHIARGHFSVPGAGGLRLAAPAISFQPPRGEERLGHWAEASRRSFFMGGILRARPSRCVLTNMINASPYLNRA